MPTYQFRCPDCAEMFEEKRPFARSADPARCPGCGGARSTKVFASTMFYAPGSAAKAMLAPGASCAAPACTVEPHGASCPCCARRQA